MFSDATEESVFTDIDSTQRSGSVDNLVNLDNNDNKD